MCWILYHQLKFITHVKFIIFQTKVISGTLIYCTSITLCLCRYCVVYLSTTTVSLVQTCVGGLDLFSLSLSCFSMYWTPNDGQRFLLYFLFGGFRVCGCRSIAKMAILGFGRWPLGKLGWTWALAEVLVLCLVLVIYLYSSILWLMVWYGLSRLLFYRVTLNVFVSVSTEQVRCMLSVTVLILLFSGPISYKLAHYSVILNLTTSNLYNDDVRKG